MSRFLTYFHGKENCSKKKFNENIFHKKKNIFEMAVEKLHLCNTMRRFPGNA
jgi:hypothetical protein